MSANSPPAGCGTPTEIVFRGAAVLRRQEHPTSASARGKFNFFKFLSSSFTAAALSPTHELLNTVHMHVLKPKHVALTFYNSMTKFSFD
jgi:hypothetical protein